MVIQPVKQAILEHQMIPKGARVLVAVSGGLDSVVLLQVLHELTRTLDFDIVVGHVDHGLRGKASTQDAAFVGTAAKRCGVTFMTHRLSQDAMHDARSLGREGAARQARYAALETMAHEAGASRIALGHTPEDQAETVLFRLARGSGPAGLKGMAPVRLPFIRPLLGIPREELKAYAQAHALEWREDASNRDVTFSRNRIRHRVIPELQQLNPNVVEAVNRAASLTGDMEAALAFLTNEAMQRIRIPGDAPELRLHRHALTDLPETVLGWVLREALRCVHGDLTGIEHKHIEAISNLIRGSQAHGTQMLPRVTVRVDGAAISFSPAPPEPVAQWRLPVNLGETALPDSAGILQLDLVALPDIDRAELRTNPWIEAADADQIAFPLHVRTRENGDRFTPLGMETSIKLKDFFINEQSPFFGRDRIPLLCDSVGIVWVAGHRLSERVKLSDDTQRVLLMTLKGVRCY